MNVEQERTEELMRTDSSKAGRKKLIIALVAVGVILALAAGIVTVRLVEKYHRQDVEKMIALGDKQLEEGAYEDAIDSYTKAIALDDRNPVYYNRRGRAYLQYADSKEGQQPELWKSAESDYRNAADLDKKNIDSRKGLIDVYRKTGDRKKQQEMYEELEEITGNDSYGDLADSAGMGNTSSNLANKGFFLETAEGAYVANAPRGGCISRVSEDGELDTMWDPGKEYGDFNVISSLNRWEDYFYFVLVTYSDGDNYGKTRVCKVRSNGEDFQPIGGSEKSYQDQLWIADGWLYHFESGELDTDSKPTLHRMGLNGKTIETLYRVDSNYKNAAAFDGRYLYLMESGGSDDEGNSSEQLVQVDIESGEKKALYEKEDVFINEIVPYKDAVYFLEREYSTFDDDNTYKETARFLKYDLKEGKVSTIYETTMEGLIDLNAVQQFCISGNRMHWFEASPGKEYAVNWDLCSLDLGDPSGTLEKKKIAGDTTGLFPTYSAAYGGRNYFEDQPQSIGFDYMVGFVSEDGKQVGQLAQRNN